MPEPLTLMAVHAHPDDEAIGTGGVLARARRRGHPDGPRHLHRRRGRARSPPDDWPSPENLARVRERELREACKILDITHLELLGYRDSGMAGTADNEHPESFAQADLDEAAGRLVALVRNHRPQVIVTYDENGFYGHPDHINAHRIAARGLRAAGDPAQYAEQDLEPWAPAKLYYTAVSRSAMAEFGRRLQEAGIESPIQAESDAESRSRWGTPDELITTVVDVSAQVERKRQALFAHATQMGPEVFFARIPPTAVRRAVRPRVVPARPRRASRQRARD